MRTLSVSLVAILLLAPYVGCHPAGSVASASTAGDDGNPPTVAARPAPEFTLEDVNGKTVRLSDSAGKVRLVDFWATWCPPCREEIPGFKELHRDYADKGLTILAISMDDDAKKVLPGFIEKNQVPYTNLIGNDQVMESFGGVYGLPTTFVIDRDGKIVETFFGGTPKEEMEAQVRKLLGMEPKS